MDAGTWSGKTLGKYEIGPLIGQGGMALVYKGRHPALKRDVAVKLIHPHLVSQEGFVERFQREAQLIAALRHPNIVQVYDFDAQAGVYYMVMEFIDGFTLAVHLQELRTQGKLFPLAQATDLLITICDALDYAHAQRMIHRDLKPGNIMFTGKGQPVLTDFGLAKLVGGTSTIASGMLVGTPMYMSPEQGYGESGDARSDIYSLGVIFFELATGQPPFEGDTPLSIIFKQVNQPLPSVRQINPRVPETIEMIIVRATAKKPEQRYQTCAEFSAALQAARPSIPRLESEALPASVAPSIHLPAAISQTPSPRTTVSLDGLRHVFVQILGPVGRIMETDRIVKAMKEKPEAFPLDRLDELLDRVATHYRIVDVQKRAQIRQGAHDLFGELIEIGSARLNRPVTPITTGRGTTSTVNESFFDLITRELVTLLGPVALHNFDLNKHIAGLGESRQVFPKAKVRQLILAVSATIQDGRIRSEFERRMFAASKGL